MGNLGQRGLIDQKVLRNSRNLWRHNFEASGDSSCLRLAWGRSCRWREENQWHEELLRHEPLFVQDWKKAEFERIYANSGSRAKKVVPTLHWQSLGSVWANIVHRKEHRRLCWKSTWCLLLVQQCLQDAALHFRHKLGANEAGKTFGCVPWRRPDL